MSTTSNMSPKNLLVLGALGIGVYFFMTKRARSAGMAQVGTNQWSQSPTRAITPNREPVNPNANLINAAAGALTSLFGGGGGAAATPAIYVPDATAVNDPAAYSSYVDRYGINGF